MARRGAARRRSQESQRREQQNQQPSENARQDAERDVSNLSYSFLSGSKTSSGGTVAYPSELTGALGSTTDYVRFKFKQYKPPFTTSSGNRGSYGGYNQSSIELDDDPELPVIFLYMPEDLSASYGTQWGGKAIQNVTASLLQSVSGKPGLKEFADDLKSAVVTGVDGADIGITKIMLEALQKTGQGEGLNVNDILGSTRGVVINPNTELLFQGFDLRTFNLSFKMVARNKPETEAIREIVSSFKAAMLPKIDERGFASDKFNVGSKTGVDRTSFIGVPDLVDVKFMLGSSENPYLTQYKPCAITGLQVNYTPDGSYATYADGQPVAVLMNVQFAETKLVYREDIRFGGVSF